MAHKRAMPTLNPMDEDLKAEQEATKIDEEAIRADIISEMGFDEIDDAERIEKAVAREVKQRTFTSKAISAKIKTREELEALKNNPAPKKENNVPLDDQEAKLNALLDARMEKRDLDSLEYPDDLKAKIQRVAKIEGVSVKKALQDPYISALVEGYEKAQKTEESAISRTNKSGGGKKEYSFNEPPNVDMSTPEGVKEWDKYLDGLKKQGL
jgi:hypothetical protein